MNKTKSAVYPRFKDRSVFISGGATGIGVGHRWSVNAKQGAKQPCGFWNEKSRYGASPKPLNQRRVVEVRLKVGDIHWHSKTMPKQIRAASRGFLGLFLCEWNNAANDGASILGIADRRALWWNWLGWTSKHAMFCRATPSRDDCRKLGGGLIINFGSVGWNMANGRYPTYGTSKQPNLMV